MKTQKKMSMKLVISKLANNDMSNFQMTEMFEILVFCRETLTIVCHYIHVVNFHVCIKSHVIHSLKHLSQPQLYLKYPSLHHVLPIFN